MGVVTLWRLQRGSVCCGVVVQDRIVVEAAPILRWTTGKPWGEVREALKTQGWHGEPLRRSAGIVIVCGGRSYPDRNHVFRTLDRLAERMDIKAIRHGGCGLKRSDPVVANRMKGADRWAHEWAAARGVPVEPMPADWDGLGRGAGPLRNAEMLARGNVVAVVAFPGGSGTADMVRRARAAGIVAWVVAV